MNSGGGNHPNSQGSSGDNSKNYMSGSQGRPDGNISTLALPRPPGTSVAQYFGPRSFNSNFVFPQPGTFHVRVNFGNGSQNPQPGCSTPAMDWRPSSQFSHQGPAAHGMSSQTTPGLPMNKDNAPYPTDSGTNQRSHSPNLSYFQ